MCFRKKVNKKIEGEQDIFDIVPALSESLFVDMSEITIDIGESLIEDVFNSDLIDQIPVVRVLKAIGTFGINLRELHLMRNTLIFLQSFKNGSITDEQISKYTNKHFKNSKRFNKELERVLLILDRQTEIEKIKILANFFRALVKRELSYDIYLDYTSLIDKILLTDVEMLKSIWKPTPDFDCKIYPSQSSKRVLNRLNTLGIGEIMFNNSSDRGPFFYYDQYSCDFINIGIFGKKIVLKNTVDVKSFTTAHDELVNVKNNMVTYGDKISTEEIDEMFKNNK